MANKTNTMTNAQAIARAIGALQNFGSIDQELNEKLEHMHKMATKKRPSSESPLRLSSCARRTNPFLGVTLRKTCEGSPPRRRLAQ